MARKKFNLDDLEISPSDKRKFEAELRRIKRGSISKSQSDKLIKEAEEAIQKKLVLRRKKAKIRLQDRRFNKFLKKALFPEKKKFFSGFGSLFRNRRFRGAFGNSSPEVAESFIGKKNFKTLNKIRKTLANNRSVRVRQFGAALGVAAIGFAISRSNAGTRRRKRPVGRPRAVKRVGRPRAKRRVGRPTLRGRR